jgi:hypothetical protein
MIVRSGTEESGDERNQTIAPKVRRAKRGKTGQNGVFCCSCEIRTGNAGFAIKKIEVTLPLQRG